MVCGGGEIEGLAQGGDVDDKICRFSRSRRSEQRQCMGCDLRVKVIYGASNSDNLSLKH